MTTYERNECGGCSGHRLEPFLDLGETPLANAPRRTLDTVEWYCPLRVVVCVDCWLAQLFDVVPDETVYGASYSFYSSTSPALVDYHTAQAQQIVQRYGEQARRLTVEIACNDGDMLGALHTLGCSNTVGVDPSSGPAMVARRTGHNVIIEPFGVRVADRIWTTYGRAGVIIANNVAAHVADLHDFFGGITTLLAPDGVAIVEVQNLADLLLGNQFDHVYHEHRYFYSLTSLAFVARMHGLQLLDAEWTAPQGGSIRATLGYGQEMSLDAQRIIASETWLTNRRAYLGTQGRVEHLRIKLERMIHARHVAGDQIAVYGVPAKAVTLLNFCRLNANVITHAVDDTPEKQYAYVPGTSIPIVPRAESDADIYLLTLWNYLPQILRREAAFREEGGRFIVPIPNPTEI